MKKITLAAITLFFATGAYSQISEFGVKGGFNVAVETNGTNDTGARVGFVGGIFMEIPLSENLSLQPELVYSMQGASSKDGSSTIVDKFDYVNLPVMLKIYVWEHRLSIDTGLQFGYLVNARIDYGSGEAMDAMSLIDNKFDVALGLGVSYKFAQRFDVGFRYNVGMIKLVDTMDNRNGVTQLTLGYRF